ncbi:GAF and ANTAR domain-containing protein [Paenarthrobacter sp. Z7-10]|uniref:GAF and ANTAR domain-containing protein n=1 Tax=Paenarthrobacter sp. Z7-10 TaxID=2787635 RepID=UPI0022A9198D|nr:GAF and ANTAR domain-containing protein [Paenarthrobacter sp. Z7-10]
MNESEAAEQDGFSFQDAGPAAASGQDKLAVRLGALARTLQQEEDAEAILTAMVHAAIELIPGVDEGSISVVTGRKDVSSRAASSELAAKVDALQAETGEGPCLDAVYEHRTVRVPDMAAEERWPGFARKANAAGAASMLSFQLYVEGDNLGALNLYSRTAKAFTDESEHVGLLIAAHAAVAFADAQKTGQLQQALSSRDIIGQAKGILMERYKITGQQAFLMLIRASQDANIKLYDIADQLVNSGEVGGPH